jgi:sulfoxide reductase heme-binding subunit YedZ
MSPACTQAWICVSTIEERRVLRSRWWKAGVFLASLTPLLALVWRAWRGELGPNPIEAVTHSTGLWTLRFLLLTLAVTPARFLFGIPDLILIRRTLGLFAFFYGSLHLLTYVWLDQFFDLAAIAKDVLKRPFITAGAVGFAAMVPLALTSTRGWIQRLGGKRWQRLHRLVYVSAIAGVVHYFWLVKSDIRPPALYGVILAILLFYRLARAMRRRRS